MLTKTATNRGKAGYWAARDSERAGKINEACALYDATTYRYGANWYGYLALGRLTTMRGQNKCQTPPQFPAGSLDYRRRSPICEPSRSRRKPPHQKNWKERQMRTN